MPQEGQESALAIHVKSGHKSVTFSCTGDTLRVKQTEPKIRELALPFRQVIGAVYEPATRILVVSYLTRKYTKGPYVLVKIEGQVNEAEENVVAAWIDTLLQLAYEGAGVKRNRRLKVIINPHGGVGKAVAAFNQIVEPILRAAGCSLDVTHTTHRGHARGIAESLPLDYDAVITLSGDGLIHEVLNGFAHHSEPIKALAIPLAPIPTGSGNGLSLNLLGMQDGFDVAAAALNVLKGQPMKVDIFSITQNGQRSLSFMSQALGLMADLDIGTEHLRWMGDTRFLLGLLRGLVAFKPCPVELSFKLAEKDKVKMADTLRARRLNDLDGVLPPSVSEIESGDGLPPLKYQPDDKDGWTTFDEPLLYVFAGKGPYVGRDFMAFPVSLPDDGLIDIVAQTLSSRTDILTSLSGGPTGELYWKDSQRYFKAHAYRVKPLTPKGTLAVDGEHFPFEEFQVEVHQGLATLLSPHGYYAADFRTDKPSKKK